MASRTAPWRIRPKRLSWRSSKLTSQCKRWAHCYSKFLNLYRCLLFILFSRMMSTRRQLCGIGTAMRIKWPRTAGRPTTTQAAGMSRVGRGVTLAVVVVTVVHSVITTTVSHRRRRRHSRPQNLVLSQRKRTASGCSLMRHSFRRGTIRRYSFKLIFKKRNNEIHLC